MTRGPSSRSTVTLSGWTARGSRLVGRHRRLLAALMLAAAAGFAVDAVAPGTPAGVPVAAAADDLPAGTVLGAGDVRMVDAPAALVPSGAVDAGAAAGRRLAAPLRRGSIVTDASLLGPGLLTGLPPGSVAVAVRPSDPLPAGLVRVGDRVQIVAGAALAATEVGAGASTAGVVVDAATVLATPEGGGGALLGAEPATALVVAVTRAEAVDLATVSDGRWLSVALLPAARQD